MIINNLTLKPIQNHHNAGRWKFLKHKTFMGSYINLIGFDYKKYREDIVPALKEGENNKLVIELSHKLSEFSMVDNYCDFKGLQSLMEYFNDDLSQPIPTLFKSHNTTHFYVDKNGNVINNNKKFDAKVENESWGYWELNTLFEQLILRYCSKYYFLVAKAYNIDDIIHFKNDTQKFADKLSNYADFWRHHSAGTGEGISGWLDIDETYNLSQHTKHLSFDYYSMSIRDWNINVLVNFINICANENLGILCGNHLLFPPNDGAGFFKNIYQITNYSEYDPDFILVNA